MKILCEGEKVVSEKLLKKNMPVWNIKVTFYRKKPDEPIVCEVSRQLFYPHHGRIQKILREGSNSDFLYCLKLLSGERIKIPL